MISSYEDETNLEIRPLEIQREKSLTELAYWRNERKQARRDYFKWLKGFKEEWRGLFSINDKYWRKKMGPVHRPRPLAKEA